MQLVNRICCTFLMALSVSSESNALDNTNPEIVGRWIGTSIGLGMALFSLKSQYDQMQMMRGGVSARPLTSTTNFEKLKRQIPDPVQTLSLYYKQPTSYASPTKRKFLARCWAGTKNWWNGVSGYQKPLNGILLHGQPGCGKTELIRALAGEGVPVFAFSGSEMQQPLVGSGEAMIRNVYDAAKSYRYGSWWSPIAWVRWLINRPAHACSVVFLDEIDSIGQKRGGAGGFSKHQDSLINQLLTLLDGTEKYDDVITIVSTNRKDLLDDALTRTGRIDVKLEVENPTKDEKKDILFGKFKEQGLKRSASLNNLFEGDVLHDFSTADCAHMPKLCRTAYVTGNLLKHKLINPEEVVIGTKLFEKVLKEWMEKVKKENKNNYMYL